MPRRDALSLDAGPGSAWSKETGVPEREWCLPVVKTGGGCEALFFNDRSVVFDRMDFRSLEECQRGLRHNGFLPVEENPGLAEIAGRLAFPLREVEGAARPVYSGGRLWKDPGGVHDLDRFLAAQSSTFETAIRELRSGRKRTHWMWFIFPQLRGLGMSAMSQRYGIASLDEARAYLDHDVLGTRLVAALQAVVALEGRSAHEVFGDIDAMKFRSCLTLFARACAAAPGREHDPRGQLIDALLSKYFAGQADIATERLLRETG